MARLDSLAQAQADVAPPFDAGELAWLPRLGAFRVRPLRAADHRAYRAFGARLDPDDLRLRFAGPIKLDSPVLCAQFREIDHDGVEVFAAFDAAGEILGVARFVRTSPTSAEIALIVRSDLKRRGLGRVLLDRLLWHACLLGLAELAGQVLYENRPMLRLAAQAGFRVIGGSGVMADLRKDLRLQPTVCHAAAAH